MKVTENGLARVQLQDVDGSVKYLRNATEKKEMRNVPGFYLDSDYAIQEIDFITLSNFLYSNNEKTFDLTLSNYGEAFLEWLFEDWSCSKLTIPWKLLGIFLKYKNKTLSLSKEELDSVIVLESVERIFLGKIADDEHGSFNKSDLHFIFDASPEFRKRVGELLDGNLKSLLSEDHKSLIYDDLSFIAQFEYFSDYLQMLIDMEGLEKLVIRLPELVNFIRGKNSVYASRKINIRFCEIMFALQELGAVKIIQGFMMKDMGDDYQPCFIFSVLDPTLIKLKSIYKHAGLMPKLQKKVKIGADRSTYDPVKYQLKVIGANGEEGILVLNRIKKRSVQTKLFEAIYALWEEKPTGHYPKIDVIKKFNEMNTLSFIDQASNFDDVLDNLKRILNNCSDPIINKYVTMDFENKANQVTFIIFDVPPQK